MGVVGVSVQLSVCVSLGCCRPLALASGNSGSYLSAMRHQAGRVSDFKERRISARFWPRRRGGLPGRWHKR